MALRRPRCAAARLGAVRRAADADRRPRARASKKCGCRAATTCRCAACQIALEAGAKARIFALNTAPVYGRIELDVTSPKAPSFELFARQHRHRPIDQRDRHQRQAHRRRRTLAPDHPQRADGKAVGSYLGKVEVARGAQQTDAEQSVKAMLLDRGATANCKPELEIFADDVKCAHGATRRRAGRDAVVLRREPRARPGERARAAARRLRHGPVGRAPTATARRDLRSRARSAAEGACERSRPASTRALERARPVPGDRRLALSRQRRDRAEAAGGDRRDHPGLCARLRDRASRRVRALGGDDRQLRSARAPPRRR